MNDIQEIILTDLIDSRAAVEKFNMIHETSSSSGSSDEDEEDEAINLLHKIDSFNERDFKYYFRLNRSTVRFIVSNFAQSRFSKNSRNHGGRPKIGCKREVLLFLYYMGNQDTFTQLSEIFKIQRSSAWGAVKRVSSWLVSVGDEYVKWPQGERAKENARKFGASNRIPGVLGAITCTQIKTNYIIKSKIGPRKRNRKIFIVFQAVVDADKKFIDIDMSCGDSRGSFNGGKYLTNSILFIKAEENYRGVFPFDTFLIGNSSYPNLDWLITPFNDERKITERHKKFNKLHLSAQKTATDTLAMLQGRFRRIQKFNEQRWIKGMMNIVASACILHNICKVMNDDFEIKDENESHETERRWDKVSQNYDEDERRELLFEYMCEKNII